MKGRDIIQDLNRRPEGKHFIKWWRRENDFSDYELVETFLDHAHPDQDFADYRLLDVEQMWEELKKVGADRVSREKRTRGEVIVWRTGEEERTCAFDARSLMSIFDVETRGNVID